MTEKGLNAGILPSCISFTLQIAANFDHEPEMCILEFI